MAGKFASAVDEVVWALSLDGCEVEVGSVEYGRGWFGLVMFSNDEAAAIEVEGGFDFRPHGAIVNEDGLGFVSVDYHDANIYEHWDDATLSVPRGPDY